MFYSDTSDCYVPYQTRYAYLLSLIKNLDCRNIHIWIPSLLQPQFRDDETSALPLCDDLEGYSSDTPDEEDIENDSEEEEDEDIVGKYMLLSSQSSAETTVTFQNPKASFICVSTSNVTSCISYTMSGCICTVTYQTCLTKIQYDVLG